MRWISWGVAICSYFGLCEVRINFKQGALKSLQEFNTSQYGTTAPLATSPASKLNNTRTHHVQMDSLLSPRAVKSVDNLRRRYGARNLGVAVVVSPDFDSNESGAGRGQTLMLGEPNSLDEPLDCETPLAAGSDAILVLAIAIDTLIRNKTLLWSGEEFGWDTKVIDVLPEFQIMDDYTTRHTTIQDIFLHQTGLGAHYTSMREETPSDWLHRLAHLKPQSEFRLEPILSPATQVMPMVLERLVQQDYVDWIKKHIFDPLGINGTFDSKIASKGGAEGWSRRGFNLTSCREWLDKTSEVGSITPRIRESCLGTAQESVGWWTNGHGAWAQGFQGLSLSLQDVVKLSQEILNPNFISSDIIEQVIAPRIANPGTVAEELRPWFYALGGYALYYRGRPSYASYTVVPGQGFHHFRLPRSGVAVSVWSNEATAVFNELLTGLASLYILDDLLHLTSEDTERRLETLEFQILQLYIDNCQTSGAKSESPRPPPPEKSLLGTYQDLAYGNISFVRVYRPHGSSREEALCKDGDTSRANLQTLFCQSIFPELRGFGHLNLDGPMYLAEVEGIWATHLLLTHHDGPIFTTTHLLIRERADHDHSYVGGGPVIHIDWVHAKAVFAFEASSYGHQESFGDVKQPAPSMTTTQIHENKESGVPKVAGVGMSRDFTLIGIARNPGKAMDEGRVKTEAAVWFEKIT